MKKRPSVDKSILFAEGAFYVLTFYGFGNSASQDKGQGNFSQIRDDKWNDTPSENCGKTDSADIFCINDHKPGGAESVADNEGYDHRKNQSPGFFAEGLFKGPHNQGRENKADDVTSGGIQESADAPFKTGKDGKADSPEKNVDDNGQSSAFSAQYGYSQEYGKGLQGEWDNRRNGDP